MQDNMVQKLKANNITPTAPRVEIARILFACDQHLSAEQILRTVNNQESVVSKATVYNTLGLFVKKGLVREVIVDPSKIFYDSNPSKHYHFYNTDTGELSDIPVDAIHVDMLPDLPEGTVSDGLEVIIKVKNQ